MQNPRTQYLVSESIKAIRCLEEPQAIEFIENVAHLLAECYRNGGKVISIGNGGSLCDAAHFAEELTGFFRDKREPLAAIAIADAAHITCVANDIGYDEVFARGVAAFGKPGDVLIALTTSGKSPSIVKAVAEAKARGLSVVCLLGKTGGALRGVGDYELIIEGFQSSDRIQEAHMAALHIIIDLLEQQLFPHIDQILQKSAMLWKEPIALS